MKYIKCRHCGAENIFGSKTCDDCGKYLTGAKAEHNHDPSWGQCAWESDGMRCSNAGALAEGTQGADRWFCSGHYECSDGKLGHQILLESIRKHGSHPDFSFESRRERSRLKAEREVPEELKGWTIEEYRENARLLIRSIGKLP